MTNTIKQQIIDIRNTGLTDMFDTNRVLELAIIYNYKELIQYIQQDRNRYFNFILHGKE